MENKLFEKNNCNGKADVYRTTRGNATMQTELRKQIR